MSSYNIAVSKASAIDLKERFNGEFHYFPNFVDTSKFIYDSKYQDKEVIQFINIAYLDPKKNQSLLIRAFNQAFQNQDKYKLKIIGNGPEMAKLKNELELLGNNNISLLGYLPQDEIIHNLQSSNFFVLSSDYETFGVVVIEAMSCGLPVASTKCGGPESIIVNEKLGILCKKNDVDELANALIELTNRKFDSDYIKNYANDNFSFEILSKKLIDRYKSIIK